MSFVQWVEDALQRAVASPERPFFHHGNLNWEYVDIHPIRIFYTLVISDRPRESHLHLVVTQAGLTRQVHDKPGRGTSEWEAARLAQCSND
jgi:hypothetical protein